ncbi:unnamed protein product [Amaranthus hypochondriacus]
MEDSPQKQSNHHEINYNPSISFVDIKLPLEESNSTFNLENAVCSHGLFLMAPNQWDPQTKSLIRPLRLSLSINGNGSSDSALVRISSGQSFDEVFIRVYGKQWLSAEEKEAVVEQVKRMLRLSEREEIKVREFQELHTQAKKMGFGRVFRSPTLFEDMVKAILFCNCQWPRTLSMSKALCDLQLELRCQSESSNDHAKSEFGNGREMFIPTTPAVKESQRKQKRQKIVSRENADAVNGSITDYAIMKSAEMVNGFQHQEISVTTSVSSAKDEIVGEASNPDLKVNENSAVLGGLVYTSQNTGNFPNPTELSSLDEKFLAKRCGLGYRAGRILKLAQGVIQGTIQLDQLEELCMETSLSNYKTVDEKLKQIEGYGPFTRGNVLMCLGFYNVVPTDSETIRHLKQVHGRTTTIQKVQEVVETMYRRYEPYQFLAYWWEIWKFYEEHFGKFSEMASSDYKLITASNMRPKKIKSPGSS